MPKVFIVRHNWRFKIISLINRAHNRPFPIRLNPIVDISSFFSAYWRAARLYFFWGSPTPSLSLQQLKLHVSSLSWIWVEWGQHLHLKQGSAMKTLVFLCLSHLTLLHWKWTIGRWTKCNQFTALLHCSVVLTTSKLRAFLRTQVNGRVNGFRMVYACARNRVAYHLLDEKIKFGRNSRVNAFSFTRGLDEPSRPRVNEPSPTKSTDTHPLLHIR